MTNEVLSSIHNFSVLFLYNLYHSAWENLVLHQDVFPEMIRCFTLITILLKLIVKAREKLHIHHCKAWDQRQTENDSITVTVVAVVVADVLLLLLLL